MKRYKQFQPIVVSDFEVDTWPHPLHLHNHYEFIFIMNGTGIHMINEYRIPYQPGDVFLVGPEESHQFKIENATRFVYVKFTDIHLHCAYFVYGLQALEYLVKSRETHLSGFELCLEDRITVRQIFDVILSLRKDLFLNEQLVWQQVLGLSVILQRNMPGLKTSPKHTRDMQALFCYLHKNIYTPDKLRAHAIAAHFNTTNDYIGTYFKRNSGTTLREYIRTYRTTLIKNRMLKGNHGLKQIAAEFGLIDESHVRKVLKVKK
ncbi:AraC family transcriptional regulator [Pedobacter sp. BMA]|uniref:AraC family transcriptional regulator n=1 Tax=Pedobacter sp. BMA TaxID=1663685 RepID=UPI00064B009B|nr:AraC family ligand binding domain-containing protein [Pedobacter sp. BMA]KLT66711.1 hypothetical protein AB669_05980 [Pedobacter sp. BMA]